MRSERNIEFDKTKNFRFSQGAVYSWCKNRKGEWFSLRDLMGGGNFYWNGTPLLDLYLKQKNLGGNSEISIEDAGKDAG